MPDITMCAATGCPRAPACYRSPESGTKPTPMRQSYAMFEFDALTGECENYWGPPQRTTNHTGVTNNDRS